MSEGLEDKLTRIILASLSGTASVVGGVISGLSKSHGILVEYQNVARYGPTLFSAAALAVYVGIEGYAQAVQNPRLSKPVYFAMIASVGAAIFGASISEYNTNFFEMFSYGIGWLAQ